MIQNTSKSAYYSIKDLGGRQKEVYEVIKRRGSICNADIAEELGLPINRVTGRTNELVMKNLVVEDKKAMGNAGRIVIYWKINEAHHIDWEELRQEVLLKREEVATNNDQLSFF